MTWARRIMLTSLLSGAGYFAFQRWQERQAIPAADPAWPPIEPQPTSPEAAPAAAESAPQPEPEVATFADVAPAGDTATPWVDSLDDGSCPITHPIKANGNSMIFHVPEGRFYQRTNAERCYVDPAAAEADGFRAAKS